MSQNRENKRLNHTLCIALDKMLAMIKEDKQPQSPKAVMATLSAPETAVAAMPRLSRSSACAPPRMLETVHEKSTGTSASAELYRTWFLGSMRCDTEDKVRGGMAFACAPPRMLEAVHEESTGAATELYMTWFLGSVRMQSCDTEGKVCGGMAFGHQSKATRCP